jgi:hypothetical protein
MKGILGLLDIVPSWLWAALLAAAVATNCATGVKLSAERLEHQTLKAETAKALAAEVQKVRELEKKLADASIRQEKTDAKNKTIVADLSRDLADQRLLDPFARGCEPKAEATGNPPSGEGHPTQAGRPLSAEFERFLKQQARDADDINIAYASCRATLEIDREILK